MPDLTVDLYADIACVHSYIGFQQLRIALATARAEGRRVSVRTHPLLIAPDAPIGASEPLRDVHRRDLGPNWQAMEATMAERGARADAPMHFERVRFTSTVPALAAIQQTQEDDLHHGEALTAALFRAYFVDGDLISDVDWLEACCREHGTRSPTIDDAALEGVHAANRDARARGIDSAPTLSLPDGRRIVGARDHERYLSLIRHASASQVAPPR